jgi:hypothetical protein
MMTYLLPWMLVGLLASPGASADGQSIPNPPADGATRPLRAAIRIETGIGLQFMPIGWFDLWDVAGRDFRAYPALGFVPFVDYWVTRYAAVGLSPDVTLNVIPNRAMESVGKMLTIEGRLQCRYPSDGALEPYVLLKPGYSVIWRTDANLASGFALGATLGLRLRFARRHGVFAELGYQRGFQRENGRAWAPSYLITSAGWQVGF